MARHLQARTTAFQDPEAAGRAMARLEELSGLDIAAFVQQAFLDAPSPDLGLSNLERWLAATASPRLHLEQLLARPSLGALLAFLLGSSQPLADALIQNPELASIVLDDAELARPVTRAAVREEGTRLLAASMSYSHSLDRLRYLRQRWTVPLVVNDLSGAWEPETVWRALSELADGIVDLSREVAWAEFARARNLPQECPVSIVAFGKLGGHELNYSSDIDLAYVAADESEAPERELIRFCEMFGRALSDRMGRGSLYRVDLRLRPYGRAGPILSKMSSVEGYYRLYAEPWEIQALLRSRVVAGPESVAARWEEMVQKQVFKPRLSEVALEAMLEMRGRIEEHAQGDDLKRGAGGIRDVEFIVQALQMLHGRESPAARQRPTVDAIRGLESAGVLEHAAAQSLIGGYTFLRQVEHRCQLVGEAQTHTVPEEPIARERLARTMHLPSWKELGRQLEAHRRTIQTLYQAILGKETALHGERAEVLERLAPHATAAVQWLDPLPESEAFYQILRVNEGSLRRLRTVVEHGPRLIQGFQQSVPLTELLLGGEIEEEEDPCGRIERLAADAPLNDVALAHAASHHIALTNWLLSPTSAPQRPADSGWEVGQELARLLDSLIRHCLRRLYAEFDVLTLGSHGRMELALDSDADLLLLVPGREQQAGAEEQAQGLVAMLSRLRCLGAPLAVDMRLRPEGKQGLLVRTYDAFRAYELERMEMWERFMLGSARLVSGSEEARALVLKAAYAMPLTPERLRELVAMKKRIESERVKPQHVRRHLKLGHGGLGDIEWLVHLHEMRFPTATSAGVAIRTDDRIRSLARARLINAVESEELLEARAHLLQVRMRLALLGMGGDVIPENPDRLDRLATACGFKNGNAFLRKHERTIDAVRSIYQEGLERLKA